MYSSPPAARSRIHYRRDSSALPSAADLSNPVVFIAALTFPAELPSTGCTFRWPRAGALYRLMTSSAAESIAGNDYLTSGRLTRALPRCARPAAPCRLPFVARSTTTTLLAAAGQRIPAKWAADNKVVARRHTLALLTAVGV